MWGTHIETFASGKAYTNLVQEGVLCRVSRHTAYEYEVEAMVPKADYCLHDVLVKSGASVKLADFVQKCLIAHPAKRITVEQALKHEFVKNCN